MEELQGRRQAFEAEARWHEGDRRKGMRHGPSLACLLGSWQYTTKRKNLNPLLNTEVVRMQLSIK